MTIYDEIVALAGPISCEQKYRTYLGRLSQKTLLEKLTILREEAQKITLSATLKQRIEIARRKSTQPSPPIHHEPSPDLQTGVYRQAG